MTRAMPRRLRGVKQLSEPQQGAAINDWSIRSLNAGADGLVEHPRRDATCRIVWKPDIHQVSFAACGAEHFKRCSEQRVEGVAEF